MPILVTGYPGNVATPLVAELLGAGADVRIASFGPVEVPHGAAAALFDFTKPATWAAAFDGVDRMFLLRPPQLSNVQRDIVPALGAARSAGVRHVVFLSIQGAERNRAVPHHAIEQWLRGSGMAWTFVRAAYFMQNLTTTHAPELARGEIFVPAGSGRTALVDARDVAAVAAAALLAPERHADRAWTVTGPEALTYDECASILTEEWGIPIRYARPGPWRYWRTMRDRGAPRALVAVTVGIYTVARLGMAAAITGDAATVTGKAPRDFRSFARDTQPPGAAEASGSGATAAVTRRKPPLALVRAINPIMRTVLRSPLHPAVDSALLLLHVTGRRSGRHYDIPVSYHNVNGRLTVLTNSPWRVNLRGGASVDVTLKGQRRPMRAQIVEAPEAVAPVYLRTIEELGWQQAQRRLGIKIHVGRVPTLEELEAVVRSTGLSVITLQPR